MGPRLKGIPAGVCRRALDRDAGPNRGKNIPMTATYAGGAWDDRASTTRRSRTQRSCRVRRVDGSKTPDADDVTYEAAEIGGVAGWCHPADAAAWAAILYLSWRCPMSSGRRRPPAISWDRSRHAPRSRGLALFETVVDVVYRSAPEPAMAFNAPPEDIARPRHVSHGRLTAEREKPELAAREDDLGYRLRATKRRRRPASPR